jgi:hypothetical protein
VTSGLMDGAAVVEILGVSMAAVLGVHSPAGKHRRVIGRCGCLLADRTGIQCGGAFAYQSVKRWGPGLSKFFDGTGVETIDGYGDHMVDRIIGLIGGLIIRGVRQNRRLRSRWRDRRRRW